MNPPPLHIRTFPVGILKATAAEEMRRLARTAIYDGTPRTHHVVQRCRAYHLGTGTLLIFTRDEGLHSSGLFKNPQYERCWHLSLSFKDPATLKAAPRDRALSREWVDLFFGRDARKLWVEPPTYWDGRQAEAWHYRLLCDEGWRGIVPRGEPYSKELTAAGWKSWSDVRAEEEAFEKAQEEAVLAGLVRGDHA